MQYDKSRSNIILMVMKFCLILYSLKFIKDNIFIKNGTH